MPQERLELIIDAFNFANDELAQLKADLEGVESGGPKAAGGLDKFKAGWQQMALVGASVAAAGYAAKKAWDFTKEGAQLELTAQQFENVANNAGMLPDVLLNEMRAATDGLVSDADLIASGLQIIELGLADSQSGVVDLATVVSRLGLDMQQVIMTFANNSEMRLDALGLSVEGVKDRAAELNDEGFDGDAFDQAVLDGLIERMEVLGDTSETTAGQMQKLEANLDNLWDRAKQTASGGIAPFVNKVVEAQDAAKLLDDLVGTGEITLSEYVTTWLELRTPMADTTAILDELNAKQALHDAQLQAATLTQNYYTDAVHRGGAAIESAASPLSYYAEFVAQATQEQAIYEQHLESAAAAQEFMNDSLTAGGKAYSSISTNVSGFVTSLQEQLDFLTAGGGALLDLAQTAQEALDEGNFAGAQEALDAAAEGAIDLDLELGKITTEQAVEQMMALGNGPEEAKLKVEELENSLFALTSQQHVVYVDLVTRGLVPGGSPSVPGAGAPVVPIEDTGGGGGLVGATAMPGASGGSGTVNWYGDAIFTSSDAALDFISQMQMQSTRSGANSAAGANYVG